MTKSPSIAFSPKTGIAGTHNPQRLAGGAANRRRRGPVLDNTLPPGAEPTRDELTIRRSVHRASCEAAGRHLPRAMGLPDMRENALRPKEIIRRSPRSIRALRGSSADPPQSGVPADRRASLAGRTTTIGATHHPPIGAPPAAGPSRRRGSEDTQETTPASRKVRFPRERSRGHAPPGQATEVSSSTRPTARLLASMGNKCDTRWPAPTRRTPQTASKRRRRPRINRSASPGVRRDVHENMFEHPPTSRRPSWRHGICAAADIGRRTAPFSPPRSRQNQCTARRTIPPPSLRPRYAQTAARRAPRGGEARSRGARRPTPGGRSPSSNGLRPTCEHRGRPATAAVTTSVWSAQQAPRHIHAARPDDRAASETRSMTASPAPSCGGSAGQKQRVSSRGPRNRAATSRMEAIAPAPAPPPAAPGGKDPHRSPAGAPHRNGSPNRPPAEHPRRRRRSHTPRTPSVKEAEARPVGAAISASLHTRA